MKRYEFIVEYAGVVYNIRLNAPDSEQAILRVSLMLKASFTPKIMQFVELS